MAETEEYGNQTILSLEKSIKKKKKEKKKHLETAAKK